MTDWIIKINDISYTDFEIIKVLDTIAGSKKFDAVFISSEKNLIFNHYDDVKIYGNSGNIIFRGRIEEIIPNHTNNTTIISGRDYVAELFDKFIVKHYDNKLRSYIVDDLVNTHSSHITRTNIQSSPIGSETTHTYKSSVWDCLVECSKEDSYRFWVDTNNDFHYKPKGYVNSGLTLILGTDDIYTFDIEEQSKEIINSVAVYGCGDPQVIIFQDDLDSQNYYGIVKAKQIFDSQLDSVESASLRADEYLASNAWVLEVITFEVDGYEDLNSGELIQVTIPSHNINNDYLVIDKNHEFPSGITTIRVAKYIKNLETVINELVNRIVNLETQEISARIQKIYETQGYSDNLTIYSHTVGDSFLLGVTGHCELGKMNLKDERGAQYVVGNSGIWILPNYAVASSEYGGTYSALKAIDGNINTHWFSVINDTLGWIYFDLITTRTSDKIRVKIHADYLPVVFDVWESDNATNWTKIVTDATVTTDVMTTIHFTQTTMRYVRLFFSSIGGQGDHSTCTEFNIYVI